MANVNPPPRLLTPKTLQKTGEERSFFEQLNVILFQLWNRTGGSTDVINIDRERLDQLENQIGENFNSFVQYLYLKDQGLPEFTVDTTGFTVDTTIITVDKVIA